MKKTQTLTEGAILAALIILLLLLGLFVPFIGVIVLWFVPIPYAIYVLRRGVKAGILLGVVTLLLSIMIFSLMGIPTVLLFASLGIVIGALYKNKKSPFIVLLGGSLATIATLLLGFIISIAFLDVHLGQAFEEATQQSIGMVEQISQLTGQELTDQQLTQINESVELLQYLITTAIIGTGVVMAFIVQFLTIAIGKRMRLQVESFPPFRKWQFPKVFVWYYLIVLLLGLVDFERGSTMFLIVTNLMIILSWVMTIQGFSFLYYYCHTKKYKMFIPNIILILGFILPPLLYLVRILGIIDLGFDLRKKISNEKET
ncbi:YybS family protein [Alkalihalobacterium bogoriense]|uniref:YybS family protein n=1 Tax=Alkalihalobacterium bogoriense TaxID=246272 RepID=UPI00047D7EFC|nr:YybS family protein [Alkalihalobacterium bogoriense]